MEDLKKQLDHMMTELQQRRNQSKEETGSKTNTSSEDDICPLCHGTGWECYIDEDKRETARECRCGIRKKMIYDSKIRFADLPDAFKDVRLSNFKKSAYQLPESKERVVEAAKAVRYWLQNLDNMKSRGVGLYIYSATKGSGKTRLAASIANELMHGYDTQVKFTTSIGILDEIKRTWDGFGKLGNVDDEYTESKLIDFFKTTDVLIIDDFGAEMAKDWVNDKFNSIINGRYVEKKITIFTSNASLDDLSYDDRIVSRIKERVFQVPFPEESVRDHMADQLKNELAEAINRNH